MPAQTAPAPFPEPQAIDRLTFVFAADSGKFNAFLDSAKKVLMLGGCSLCRITHGLVGEKSEWKECKEEIGVPIDYLHRDELDGPMSEAVGDDLPCIVAHVDGDLVKLVGSDVLDRVRGSVADLKGRLATHAAMRRLYLPL